MIMVEIVAIGRHRRHCGFSEACRADRSRARRAPSQRSTSTAMHPLRRTRAPLSIMRPSRYLSADDPYFAANLRDGSSITADDEPEHRDERHRRQRASHRARIRAIDGSRPWAASQTAFRALHEAGCFVIPNPWDVGSARYLQHLGFPALATTSAGFAFSQGLPDSDVAVSRDRSLAHIAEIAAAVDLPVNADFASGYGDSTARGG